MFLQITFCTDLLLLIFQHDMVTKLNRKHITKQTTSFHFYDMRRFSAGKTQANFILGTVVVPNLNQD